MSGVIFLVLAAVQGVAGVLPISGFGHVVILAVILGVSGSLSPAAVVILHLGTAAAVVYQFRRDILKTLYSAVGIVQDLVHNLKQWIIHRRDPENADYTRVLADNYSRLLVLTLITTVFTAPAAILTDRISAVGNFSVLLAAFAGFLVTALVLSVSSRTLADKRSPKDVYFRNGILIGIFAGFGILPGLSCLALVQAGTFLCGFSDKFSRRTVYILMLPAIFGSLVYYGITGRLVSFGTPAGFIVLGVVICAFAGIVTCKLVFPQMGRENSRRAAWYAVGAAAASLIVYFVK